MLDRDLLKQCLKVLASLFQIVVAHLRPFLALKFSTPIKRERIKSSFERQNNYIQYIANTFRKLKRLMYELRSTITFA